MNIERVNRWFLGFGGWVTRYRWVVFAVFVLVLLGGVGGLGRLDVSSSWDDYFLEDDPMLLKTEEFKSVFGNDNYVAVLTECDSVFTYANLRLLRLLSSELLDSLSYAERVTSVTDAEFMVGTEDGMRIEGVVPEVLPRSGDSLQGFLTRLRGKPHVASRLVSSDGRMSWILVKLRPYGPDSVWRSEPGGVSPEYLTGMELARIISKDVYAPLRPRGAGLPYVTVRKMEWIRGEMPRVMGLAVALSLLVLLLVTRSFRGVLVPIVTAISSIVIVYGLLGYLGMTIDSGMILIPMLLAFAVAVAYNIHVLSYFRRSFRGHGDRLRAVRESVGAMGWPVLFSALTTFAALLSFLAIPMQPMRFVGVATSLCVLFSFAITMTLMPSLLSFGRDRAPGVVSGRVGGGGVFDGALGWFGGWVLRHSGAVLVLAFLSLVFFGWGFTRVETAFDIERTMGRRVAYVRDVLDVGQSELGSVYMYDLLIEFATEGEAKRRDALLRLDTLSGYALTFGQTKRTTSILDVVKDLNQTLHSNSPSHYGVPGTDEEVAQLLLLYENAGGSEAEYWMDYEYRRLRLMTEVRTYNSGETEREMDLLMSRARALFPDASVTVVGSIPQFTVMMQYVARGQVVSFLLSLVIIGILMMVVFGSVRVGLIGLIPNITPAVVVGGLMGWLDYPLDMMTATIMPMILGLAVDDTIHFINHGRLEFARLGNYRAAILRSFGVVGVPLVLTSVVIGSNFGIYMTSESSSFLHMGFLAVAGVFSALLSDLCVTPLLFSRFRLFGRER